MCYYIDVYPSYCISCLYVNWIWIIRLCAFYTYNCNLLVMLAGSVDSECSCCCPCEPKVEMVYEEGLTAAKLVGTILNTAPLAVRTYKKPSGPVCKSVIPPNPNPNLSKGICADVAG